MKNYPVVKVAILFAAGILSAQFFQTGILPVTAAFVSTLILFLFIRKVKNDIYFLIIVSVSAGLLVFFIGNYMASENPITPHNFINKFDKVKNTTAFGEVTKIDLIRNNELIFYLAVDSVYSDEFFIKDKLNLLCKAVLDKKSVHELYNELKPGNYVEVKGFFHKGKQRRNPGEFDYNAYLQLKDISGIIRVDDITSITILGYDVNILKNVIHQVRKAIDQQLKEYHSPETAALLRGLLLADRGEITYQTKTQFINAGVIHVLAVSGLHVGYIILIFLFLFGRFNLFIKSILTITGLIAFMMITGAPPSVFRSTVMAVVLIIAFLSNRSTNLINSISIAALIILVINPNEIHNPGFQLSFSAVLAIGLILPYLNQVIEGWNIKSKILRYLLLFWGVSLCAQIGTLPFTLLYFNKYSTISFLTNLIVIPSIGFIIAAAILTLFFSAVIPVFAIYLAAATDLLTSIMLSLIKFSGDLSFSHIIITNYSIADLILLYLMLAVFLYFFERFTHIKAKLVLLILIIANTVLLSSIDDTELLPDNMLSVFMIDVGQGDSFLIKFPNGETALVDAGNTTINFDYGERVIIPLLDYLGIKKINYGIVTHIDADHYGGFIALILENRISRILKPEIDSSLTKDMRFEEFIRSRKIPINYFSKEKLKIGNTAVYFLNDVDIINQSGKSTNDRSGIFKIVYGETSFLFTGDVEKKMERLYANKYKSFLNSDVLKVGHHGSKTSTSNEFLSYVKPKVSLISAGFKNQFGHPAAEILERLETNESTIYRTDLQKAVLLRSDGEQIEIIKW